MLCPSRRCFLALTLTALLPAAAAWALESDRQQPLEVKADSTGGTLGDGVTVLRGNVDIRQGSLHIQADVAEVEKAEGKVREVVLRGNPARLEQEIEKQGLVQAEAATITYLVGNGLVRLEGGADVRHPQYQIAGEALTYDLDAQHFEGAGGEDGSGRVRIRLDPEVAPGLGVDGADTEAATENAAKEAGNDDD